MELLMYHKISVKAKVISIRLDISVAQPHNQKQKKNNQSDNFF